MAKARSGWGPRTKEVAEYQRWYWMERNYGITRAQYEALLVAQNERCAICGQPETAVRRKTGVRQFLSVDHDHATGKVRGLLCLRCNGLLGVVEKLRRAAPSLLGAMDDYLNRAG